MAYDYKIDEEYKKRQKAFSDTVSNRLSSAGQGNNYYNQQKQRANNYNDSFTNARDFYGNGNLKSDNPYLNIGRSNATGREVGDKYGWNISGFLNDMAMLKGKKYEDTKAKEERIFNYNKQLDYDKLNYEREQDRQNFLLNQDKFNYQKEKDDRDYNLNQDKFNYQKENDDRNFNAKNTEKLYSDNIQSALDDLKGEEREVASRFYAKYGTLPSTSMTFKDVETLQKRGYKFVMGEDGKKYIMDKDGRVIKAE
ncbi:hypothetical protein F1B92_00805 [Campylobacter sp. FMV-PI01]|uniref:Uncharacterized protein n=1 Tax=Campylobacter portucalensis TaxID=2608384 RepID=A0A6L5WG62_9BACT|nr:hypothetical protein [Campylobacter portucalensis]MSN95746.1 hypothetical protein [Campylobacter portucalensis]